MILRPPDRALQPADGRGGDQTERRWSFPCYVCGLVPRGEQGAGAGPRSLLPRSMARGPAGRDQGFSDISQNRTPLSLRGVHWSLAEAPWTQFRPNSGTYQYLS
jgi:hypothetical protein